MIGFPLLYLVIIGLEYAFPIHEVQINEGDSTVVVVRPLKIKKTGPPKINKQAQSSERIIIINKVTNIRNGNHVRNFK